MPVRGVVFNLMSLPSASFTVTVSVHEIDISIARPTLCRECNAGDVFKLPISKALTILLAAAIDASAVGCTQFMLTPFMAGTSSALTFFAAISQHQCIKYDLGIGLNVLEIRTAIPADVIASIKASTALRKGTSKNVPSHGMISQCQS